MQKRCGKGCSLADQNSDIEFEWLLIGALGRSQDEHVADHIRKPDGDRLYPPPKAATAAFTSEVDEAPSAAVPDHDVRTAIAHLSGSLSDASPGSKRSSTMISSPSLSTRTSESSRESSALV